MAVRSTTVATVAGTPTTAPRSPLGLPAGGGGGALAEWENAGKAYAGTGGGPIWAVRGIDLRVGPGEVLGVVGPNRAGKTTLVKLLLSLCRPTEGRVRRFGWPASQRRTLGRIGYVPDDPAFPADMTARGVLAYHGALSLLDPAVERRRSAELLERVGLADRAREPIGRFSKGMLQRLALAQALLNEPELLVLGEPAEGLDLAGRALLGGVVAERRARGGAVLLIAHAPAEIERLCDRLAVLVGGRKVFDGPIAALAAPPAEPAAGASPPPAPVPLETALARLYHHAGAGAGAGAGADAAPPPAASPVLVPAHPHRLHTDHGRRA